MNPPKKRKKKKRKIKEAVETDGGKRIGRVKRRV
jgi:hypothetical protein